MFEPEGHVVILGAPAPVQVGVAVHLEEMFPSDAEHAPDKARVRQPGKETKQAL